MIKRYSELALLNNYKDRLEYLKTLNGVGEDTFGFDRYLNQRFYQSKEWKDIRAQIIIRDGGCDLGIPDYPIQGSVYIHHINPLTKEDILARSDSMLDPENLICVSYDTHQAIHYGFEPKALSICEERKPNDTIPWRL